MSEDFIEESTTPFTGKYQEQAKRIERNYKIGVAITTVFIVLMGGFSVYFFLAWLIGRDGWYLALTVVDGFILWNWSRDYRSHRKRRAEDYIRLTNQMAMDINIQKLIDHEEDHQ